MVLLKTLLRRIVQTNHMPRADWDEITTSARLGEQRTSLCLRAQWSSAAGSSETENIIAVAGDDVDWSGGSRRFFDSAPDGKQFPEADDVEVVEVELEDAFVVGARLSPEVAPAAWFGGRDKVGWVVAGETGGVECGGEGDGLGEVGGDGDDGDAEAGEDKGGDVGGVVGCLGIAEDRAVGVADVDYAFEGSAYRLCKSR